MKILVTGGGGFLGSKIIEFLLQDKSHEIINFSRNKYIHLDELNVSTIQGDLKKMEDVDRALSEKFDVIFHVASLAGVWGNPKDYDEVNIKGTENLIQASKNHGVKALIYTSTPSVVFDKEDLLGLDETLPYSKNILNDYQRTKIIAEQMVLAANSDEFKTCAIRPHLIFGPLDPHIFPRILEKARLGKLKRVGTGENLVDVTYVDNAAHAHILALNKIFDPTSKVAGEAFFIGNEKPVNLWAFIDQILTHHKLPILTESVSVKKAYAAGVVLEKIFKLLGVIKPEPPMTRFTALNLGRSHYFSHKKAEILLGYKPLVSVEEGLLRSIKKSLKGI